MHEPSFKEYFYRLSRWLLKEVPIMTMRMLQGKATVVDLLGTPIGLICLQARAAGQRQAQLSDQARGIEWLAREVGEMGKMREVMKIREKSVQ